MDHAKGLLPLTVPEIRHPLAALVGLPPPGTTAILDWSLWRRRHRQRARRAAGRGDIGRCMRVEIELSHEDQVFERPDWLGIEATDDLRFRQSTLLHLCGRSERPVSMADILACPAA